MGYGYPWQDRGLEDNPAPSRRPSNSVLSSVPEDRPTDDRETPRSRERSKPSPGTESVAALLRSDPDHELVAKCRAGNRQAFNLLVLRHKDRLYTLAVRLLGDRGEAEDITQEAFLRAYEQIEEFRGEAKFSTWLYRICYNLCLNHLERKKNIPEDEVLPEGLPDPAGKLPDQLIAKERQDLVHQALSRLRLEFREVILLYHTGQLSYEAIASLLGLPVGTVRSRLYRGREGLKELLYPYLQEEA